MNKKFNPLVSIVIPVYNGSNYLKEAIDSALAQTYSNIEIIVVNDGSIDAGKTEEIALSYGDRIRYFKKENGGVATALNLGIETMRGEYFSWLSHDDIYMPEKIEKQLELLSKIDDDGIYIVSSNYLVINEKNELINCKTMSSYFEKSIKLYLAFNFDTTGVHGCSLLIPKKLFDICGGFDKNLKCTQDYDMWYKMSKYAKFLRVHDFLVKSRAHDEQDSKTKTDIASYEADLLHSRITSELDIDEVENVISGDKEYLYKALSLYKNAGYLRTASQIEALILKLQNKDGNLRSALKKLYGMEDNKFHNNVKKLFYIKENENKPIILLHNDYWIMGGIERVWTIIIQKLKQFYKFVLISNNLTENDKRFPLPEEVDFFIFDEFRITNDQAYNMLFIANVLQPSLYIENSLLNQNILNIFSLLSSTKIKTIASHHMFYFLTTQYEMFLNLHLSKVNKLSYANVVTALTTFNTNIFNAQNINAVYVPNPNTFEQENEFTFKEKRDKVVIAVARFDDNIKRIDRILKAFKFIVNNHNDAKLLLVGKLPENINTLINENNLSDDALIMVGEQKNVSQFYKIASVLILTSESEGFGMVLNEAGSHGLPCVINEISGLDDIIIEGENGFIVPQNDLNAMAKKVCLLFEEKNLYERMSKKSFELAKRFDQKIIAERWKNLIDLVINTEKQDDLNILLKEHFPLPNENSNKFVFDIIKEYDKSIKNVMQMYKHQQNSEIVQSLEESSDVMEKKTEIDKKINYINKRGKLYKLYYYARHDRQRLKEAIKWRLNNKPILYKLAKKIYCILRFKKTNL